MPIAPVLYRIGWLLVFIAVGMVSPLAFALVAGEEVEILAFTASGLVSAFCGVGLILAFQGYRGESGTWIATVFVSLAWVIVPFFAALPFLASDALVHPADAYFEAVSGLTTTGATLMTLTDETPRSLIVWRAVLQWMGGLGTLVVASVVLSAVLWRGVALANVPFPGSRQTTMMGRLGLTLSVLWPVYTYMTGVLFFLLWGSGVPVFDALCLSFSTVSTGGMMPTGATLEAYGMPMTPWLLGLAMGVAGVNVMLHWYAARGRFAPYREDYETRHYLLLLAAAIVLTVLSALIMGAPGIGAPVFMAVSLISTTGFVWDGPAVLPYLPMPLVLVLVAIGGSAFSTAGGLKVARLVLMLKHSARELARLAHPHGVARVKYGGVTVEEGTLGRIAGAFLCFVLVLIALTAAVASFGVPFPVAASASVASLSNTGPALFIATVGEVQFTDIPQSARHVLCLAMILGRLEILVLLSVLNPAYWQR